jgi:hypothetical protein
LLAVQFTMEIAGALGLEVAFDEVRAHRTARSLALHLAEPWLAEQQGADR